jgi:probable HAF family extracellular repeat protein
MRRLWLLSILALCSLVILAGAAMAAAPDLWFKVTELAVPEGTEVAAINGVTGMNDQADVVGAITTSDYKSRAIFWDHSQDVGTLLPLLPGCDQSEAFAVNESGQVVGRCWNYSTVVEKACLWQQGGVQALDPPTGLGSVTGTGACGINDQGQAVGYAYLSNPGGQYPMLWDHGPAQPLEAGTPSHRGSANCINNSGVVGVGAGFLWTKAGGFKSLDPNNVCEVKGSNTSGQAVGSDGGKPCVWNSQGGITYLDSLTSGSAYGINDLGQIVGQAYLTSGYISFLWQAGKLTDLNKSLLGYDWTSMWPYATNNGMQIAAIGRRSDSQTINRAVLLSAVTRRPSFRLTDLGPGVTPHRLGGRGQIVGESGGQAFIRQGGQLKYLGLGAAWGINGPGKIVGAGYIGSNQTAVSWDSKGAVAPLENGGSRLGMAYAVNQSGMAAGKAQDTRSFQQPCIWKADGTLQFLTSDQGRALGINDSNLVVGYHYPNPTTSQYLPFACTVGAGFLDLSSGLGAAYGVNGSGQVVGWYYPPGVSSSRAFIWQAGKIMDLTKLESGANGINTAGQVVGWANSLYGGNQFGFLWDPALGLMDLNELVIPSQPDWVLSTAYGINSNMQIIGYGKYQGADHGFLLDRVGTCASETVSLLLLQ